MGGRKRFGEEQFSESFIRELKKSLKSKDFSKVKTEENGIQPFSRHEIPPEKD